MIDVIVEVVVDVPRERLASFAGDPSNAPGWYSNIDSATWLTEPPLRVGSRIAFRARFLGRVLEYVYEVAELQPGRRLVMRTEQGPFPMETTYTWDDEYSGGTRMRLRNRGEPTGFAGLAAPVVAAAVRRATRRDLRRLVAAVRSADAARG